MDEIKLVEAFLNKQGFPFEMYVAHELRKAGFDAVYQSNLFNDPYTDKTREIDVIAYFTKHLDLHHSIQIKIIVECKHAATPWILFSSEHEGFDSLGSRYFYCCNKLGQKLFDETDIYEALLGSSLFKIDRYLGYGLAEVDTKDRTKKEVKNSYDAIMKLISVLLYEQKIEHEKEKQERNISEYIVYVPIIAIEGSLYKASYLGDENINLEKINEGQLLYKANVYEGVFPLIDLCTKEKFPSLAIRLYEDCEKLYSSFKEKF